MSESTATATLAPESAARADKSRRTEPRLKMPTMYTLVRVRVPGDEHYRWIGHIYDLSLSGMRFEIDEALAPGTEVEIRAMLPGHRHTIFRATGQIVRQHDDHPGIAPVRMAMRFDRFHNSIDHYRLANYLATAGLKRTTAATSRPIPITHGPQIQRPAA